jgi:hypothetical protein
MEPGQSHLFADGCVGGTVDSAPIPVKALPRRHYLEQAPETCEGFLVSRFSFPVVRLLACSPPICSPLQLRTSAPLICPADPCYSPSRPPASRLRAPTYVPPRPKLRTCSPCEMPRVLLPPPGPVSVTRRVSSLRRRSEIASASRVRRTNEVSGKGSETGAPALPCVRWESASAREALRDLTTWRVPI